MFDYRMLQSNDAEAWKDLRLKGVRDFPLGFLITPQEAARTSSENAKQIISVGTLRGVFHDRDLVGFCDYRPQRFERTRHRGEIVLFFVSQHMHGTGAAKVLLNGIILEARAEGIEQLELTVSPENHRAVAFYEREGFERFGVLPDAVRMDDTPSDELLYRLRLR